jgi:hypothetical protein
LHYIVNPPSCVKGSHAFRSRHRPVLADEQRQRPLQCRRHKKRLGIGRQVAADLPEQPHPSLIGRGPDDAREDAVLGLLHARSTVGNVGLALAGQRAPTLGAQVHFQEAERAVQLGSPLTKVSEVIGRRVVRGVLAQPDPKLDMRAVLRKGQVVVVNVAPGQIGAPAARLIAALVIHGLFKAVQGRAAIPAAQRRPFFAYVDEPKVLGDIPMPIDSLFELARGLGVGLTLGAQSLTQLPLHVTLPLAPASSDPAAIRKLSSQRFGADLATVDAALGTTRGGADKGR